jgi:hypothetical protein
VCDDFFGTPDAQVACRQLGFSTTGERVVGCNDTGLAKGAVAPYVWPTLLRPPPSV